MPFCKTRNEPGIRPLISPKGTRLHLGPPPAKPAAQRARSLTRLWRDGNSLNPTFHTLPVALPPEVASGSHNRVKAHDAFATRAISDKYRGSAAPWVRAVERDRPRRMSDWGLVPRFLGEAEEGEAPIVSVESRH
jgi:hypothetical protein